MFRKLVFWIAAIAAAGVLAWSYSPWPSALFYRVLMDRGGIAMHDALAKHVPQGVSALLDQSYETNDADARFDLFRPADKTDEALPVVIWIHGGAFLSGGKDQVANYLKILASRGVAAIGINYSLAPSAQYPKPVEQAAAALRYFSENASGLGLDRNRIILAGDSAGAQLAGQLTAIVSDADYAEKIGVAAPIAREQLRGTVLFCGLLDAEHLNADGAYKGFLTTAVWSYIGTKDFAGSATLREMSVVKAVTGEFPPLFISAGNADPLLGQSKAMAEAARTKGVAVDTLFFPDDTTPGLQHEYQFNLDAEAGRLALERTAQFIADRVN